MGFAKRKMEEDEERGAGFVRELIDGGYLEDAALGVAKLWVDKGDDAITAKQRWVLKEYVFGPFVTAECFRCSNTIPWCEMLTAHDNGGLCSWCAHMEEKLLVE